jgi:hypothetical protein
LQKKDYKNASDRFNNWDINIDSDSILFSEDNLDAFEKFYNL